MRGVNQLKVLMELDGLRLTKESSGSYLIIHDGFQILTQDYHFVIDYLDSNVLHNLV